MHRHLKKKSVWTIGAELEFKYFDYSVCQWVQCIVIDIIYGVVARKKYQMTNDRIFVCTRHGDELLK
jgi:hypothetical protein